MLSEELVIDLAGLAPNRKVCASTCMTRKIDKKACECYPGMRTTEALEFARAVEAEVRKQDDALIRQMHNAMSNLTTLCLSGGSPLFTAEFDRLIEATAAARARLGERT